LVEELIRLKVDVIVVVAGNEARAAKNATKTIPIVGLNLSEPVQYELVENLARPGATLTGVTAIEQIE
jgi:putative ABC transport system substrate-binding protein